MADLVLGRVKFVWRQTWSAAVAYTVDDCVHFNGRAYMCIQNTSAGQSPRTTAASWDLMADGITWKGVYNAATEYEAGSIVTEGASSYLCTTFAAANIDPSSNPSNWSALAQGFGSWAGDWASGQTYAAGDTVSFTGSSWTCVTATALGESPTTHPLKWDLVTKGFDDQGNYNNANAYSYGQTVTFAGSLWLVTATAGVGVGEVPFDYPAKWRKTAHGSEWLGAYNAATFYYPDQEVLFNLNSYRCTAKTAANESPQNTPAKWTQISAAEVIQFGDFGSITDPIPASSVDLGFII